MQRSHSYLMENDQEAFRLDIKTDPEAVRKEAHWCGVSPGLRVLDAGCGPGKVTSILYETIQPGGSILGVDYSRERINHAKKKHPHKSGIDFRVHDLRNPLEDTGLFDLIWVRFALEYNRAESIKIVENLTTCLKPGGHLCLLDLDYNCLSHYELTHEIEDILLQVMTLVEKAHNFDPYAGRKLYSYLYDLGYENIQMDLRAHHLIYGKTNETDLFNWTKKLEMAATKASEIFEDYPGGYKKFFTDFVKFFNDPRRFTYTPLILCKGMKPV
ncbi:MAG: class I SAM-dependent methyltransferase [Deltaproteobacteria bacterium]|jgi:SAM-dependent methyltransferase|nr:class I SAM-dependent methyltransferase [Deltaproteobacteria bacterium]